MARPITALGLAKKLLTPESEWHVQNHYVTNPDHPSFGPGRVRQVERITSSRVYFTDGSHIDWPKAAQIQADTDVVRLFGGGVKQNPEDLFITLTRQAPGTLAATQTQAARLAARTPEQLLAAGEDPRGATRLVQDGKYAHLETPVCTCGERLWSGAAGRDHMQQVVDKHLADKHAVALAAYDVLQQIARASASFTESEARAMVASGAAGPAVIAYVEALDAAEGEECTDDDLTVVQQVIDEQHAQALIAADPDGNLQADYIVPAPQTPTAPLGCTKHAHGTWGLAETMDRVCPDYLAAQAARSVTT